MSQSTSGLDLLGGAYVEVSADLRPLKADFLDARNYVEEQEKSLAKTFKLTGSASCDFEPAEESLAKFISLAEGKTAVLSADVNLEAAQAKLNGFIRENDGRVVTLDVDAAGSPIAGQPSSIAGNVAASQATGIASSLIPVTQAVSEVGKSVAASGRAVEAIARQSVEPIEVGGIGSGANVIEAESGIEPVKSGYARMYHGGNEQDGGGPRWFSPDRNYAQGYADKTGGSVSYVDVPENATDAKGNPILRKAFDDEGTSSKAPYVNVELPEEIAKNRKPYIEGSAASSIVPEVTKSKIPQSNISDPLERHNYNLKLREEAFAKSTAESVTATEAESAAPPMNPAIFGKFQQPQAEPLQLQSMAPPIPPIKAAVKPKFMREIEEGMEARPAPNVSDLEPDESSAAAKAQSDSFAKMNQSRMTRNRIISGVIVANAAAEVFANEEKYTDNIRNAGGDQSKELEAKLEQRKGDDHVLFGIGRLVRGAFDIKDSIMGNTTTSDLEISLASVKEGERREKFMQNELKFTTAESQQTRIATAPEGILREREKIDVRFENEQDKIKENIKDQYKDAQRQHDKAFEDIAANKPKNAGQLQAGADMDLASANAKISQDAAKETASVQARKDATLADLSRKRETERFENASEVGIIRLRDSGQSKQAFEKEIDDKNRVELDTKFHGLTNADPDRAAAVARQAAKKQEDLTAYDTTVANDIGKSHAEMRAAQLQSDQQYFAAKRVLQEQADKAEIDSLVNIKHASTEQVQAAKDDQKARIVAQDKEEERRIAQNVGLSETSIKATNLRAERDNFEADRVIREERQKQTIENMDKSTPEQRNAIRVKQDEFDAENRLARRQDTERKGDERETLIVQKQSFIDEAAHMKLTARTEVEADQIVQNVRHHEKDNFEENRQAKLAELKAMKADLMPQSGAIAIDAGVNDVVGDPLGLRRGSQDREAANKKIDEAALAVQNAKPAAPLGVAPAGPSIAEGRQVDTRFAPVSDRVAGPQLPGAVASPTAVAANAPVSGRAVSPIAAATGGIVASVEASVPSVATGSASFGPVPLPVIVTNFPGNGASDRAIGASDRAIGVSKQAKDASGVVEVNALKSPKGSIADQAAENDYRNTSYGPIGTWPQKMGPADYERAVQATTPVDQNKSVIASVFASALADTVPVIPDTRPIKSQSLSRGQSDYESAVESTRPVGFFQSPQVVGPPKLEANVLPIGLQSGQSTQRQGEHQSSNIGDGWTKSDVTNALSILRQLVDKSGASRYG